MNHHTQRIPRHRQIGKDTCRPEQCVSVTRYYFHSTKALYGSLKSPIEIRKHRWPIFEQGSGITHTTCVALIDLTKRPITPRAYPSHKGFARSMSPIVIFNYAVTATLRKG